MKVLGSFSSTLSDGVKVVADKTKKATGVASLKAKINTTNADLAKLYKELGQAYCDNDGNAEAIQDILEEIKVDKDKINVLEKKLALATGKIKCEVCGEYVNTEYSFCPKCGEKVVLPVPEEKITVEALKEKINAATDKVKETVKDAELKEKIGEAADKVKETVKDAELKDKLENAGNKVKEFAQDKELKDKFETVGSKAKEVAKDLGGMVGSAIDASKEYFSKKTPSDIVNMEDVADEPSVDAEDVEKAAEDVAEAVEDAAKDVAETVADAAEDVAEAVKYAADAE